MATDKLPGHAGETLKKAGDVAGVLQDMVLEGQDVSDFLAELAHLAADRLASPRLDVYCGVTLLRRRRPLIVMSSHEWAQALGKLQYALGEGPSLTAVRMGQVVHIEDMEQEYRWQGFHEAVAGQGVRSVLSLPIPMDGSGGCALTLYARPAAAFDEEAVAAAEGFAGEVSQSLRVAVRIARLNDTAANLKNAMTSRTVIDIAAGILMGQNRCSHDAALSMLRDAAYARGLGLGEVAASVVAGIGVQAPVTHFEE